MPTLAVTAPAAGRRRSGPWLSAAALFFLSGVLLASWATEVPRIKATLALNDPQLGGALLGLVLGSVMVLPIMGSMLARFGLGAVAGGAALLGALALLAAAAGDAVVLGLSLVVYGAAFGAQDVALNDAGVLLEREARRPLLSGLHAMYSLGALMGALSGAALIWLGIGSKEHFLGLLVLAALLSVSFAPSLPAAPQAKDGARNDNGPRGRTWTWPLVALGALAACAAVAEGAVADWAGVYLKETVRSPEGVEALGFAGFSLAMLIGRLFGDGLSLRWGPVQAGRTGALIAAAGVGLAVGVPQVVPALCGFALMGLGLSVLAPLAFSAVARVAPHDIASAVAGVAVFFYVGYLAGPPVIGTLAQLGSPGMALVATLGRLSAGRRGRPGSPNDLAGLEPAVLGKPCPGSSAVQDF